MSKHPNKILGFKGTIDDMATHVANMDVDETSYFILKLADDIKQQADNDSKRGRNRLAKRLYQTSEHIYGAREEINYIVDEYKSQGKYILEYDFSLDLIAKKVGNMKYNKTSKFIKKLAYTIKERAMINSENALVVDKFHRTSNKLYLATENLDSAWKICKPRMK